MLYYYIIKYEIITLMLLLIGIYWIFYIYSIYIYLKFIDANEGSMFQAETAICTNLRCLNYIRLSL